MAGAATTALTALTIVSSIALRLSPLPDYYRIYRHASTGEVALLPVVALLVNSGAVGLYAFAIGNFVPLLATNAFGVCMALLFVAVFLRYAADRARVLRVVAAGLAALALVLVYTVLAVSGATRQSIDQVGTTLGWVTMATSVAQFGSPLATAKRVVQTKSSASLPFTMCLMNVVNGALWVAYSSVDWNAFVFAPNVFSVALGVTQLVLWALYRPRADASSKTKDLLAEDSRVGDSVVIEMSRHRLERVSSCVSTDSGVFHELASPSKP